MQSLAPNSWDYYFVYFFSFADIILIQSLKTCPIEEFYESVKVQEEKNYVL